MDGVKEWIGGMDWRDFQEVGQKDGQIKGGRERGYRWRDVWGM